MRQPNSNGSCFAFGNTCVLREFIQLTGQPVRLHSQREMRAGQRSLATTHDDVSLVYPSGADSMLNKLLDSRWLSMLVVGGVLMQVGGCTFTEVNELLQTVFLGVTAAGGYIILRNI